MYVVCHVHVVYPWMPEEGTIVIYPFCQERAFLIAPQLHQGIDLKSLQKSSFIDAQVTFLYRRHITYLLYTCNSSLDYPNT